jgi:hypothetical protein
MPPDDVNDKLTVANPDDPKMCHVSVSGDTYTIIMTGAETADGGRSGPGNRCRSSRLDAVVQAVEELVRRLLVPRQSAAIAALVRVSAGVALSHI